MNNPDLLGQLRIDRSATTAPASGKSRIWIISIVALIAMFVGWWIFFRSPPPTPVRTVVAVAASTAAPINTVLDASGYVVARRQATVSAKITGKVREVMIEEGMRVEQDQILATLDDTDQQADVQLRRAQLASARSQLAEIEAGLRQARADLLRQQELFERKLTSAAQLDAARAQSETLVARLASQRQQIEVVAQTLALSQVSLDNTIIRAPFAGIVVAKAAQPGEMISPISAGGGFTRTGIGTIVDMDSLEVEVDVNEAFIGRVTAKMPVEATLNAYPDWAIPGEVIAVIPAADRNKATVRVRVALSEKDARIVPDMGVRVAFLESRAADAPAPESAPRGVFVPAGAVVERDGRSVALVVQAGTVVERVIEVSAPKNGGRQILSGVQAGETLVIEPKPELKDGMQVRDERD